MAPGTWETQDKARAALQRWLTDPKRVESVYESRTHFLKVHRCYTFRWRGSVWAPWRYASFEELSP